MLPCLRALSSILLKAMNPTRSIETDSKADAVYSRTYGKIVGVEKAAWRIKSM